MVAEPPGQQRGPPRREAGPDDLLAHPNDNRYHHPFFKTLYRDAVDLRYSVHPPVATTRTACLASRTS